MRVDQYIQPGQIAGPNRLPSQQFQARLLYENHNLIDRDYKHAIHGEKITCMHLSFGKKLNKWNIWLAISGQSNCIDHKMACKACLAWESEGAFLI